jgi:hypothetical protein
MNPPAGGIALHLVIRRHRWKSRDQLQQDLSSNRDVNPAKREMQWEFTHFYTLLLLIVRFLRSACFFSLLVIADETFERADRECWTFLTASYQGNWA